MRDDFSVRFQKSIEPGIIKIFDFNLQNNPDVRNKDPNIVAKEIRILSLKDTEFMLDKCTYDDCKVNSQDDQMFPDIVKSSNKKHKYEQKNEIYYNYIYSPLRAFSMCWPFIAFSGLGNFIILINAYENTKIRRIQVADQEKSITIC
jgi:hypothetical protein